MRTRRGVAQVVVALSCGGLLGGCFSNGEDRKFPGSGSSDAATGGTGGSGAAAGGTTGSGGPGTNPGVSLGTGGSGTGGTDPLPEETEAPTFRFPVVTGRYLWSANPASGRVALIDAETLTTKVLTAGLLPTYLVAVPSPEDQPAAIVLNVGSSDATLFRVAGDAVRTTHTPVHFGANRWALSGSGRWAAAWTESGQGADELDPTEGLQELSLLDLEDDPPSRRRISVGYRPSQVVFDEQEERLIVVSSFGISLVELATDELSWVSLGEGQGRDVSITRDGSRALVRRSGSSLVELVDLGESGDVESIDLGGVITDLDLAPSGRAVAVVREKSLLATFVVTETFGAGDVDTVTFPGELVGSAELTDDGATVVLYSNAAETSRVTVVDLTPGDTYLAHRTLTAETPVESVVVSPDGKHAVALGKGTEGAETGSFSVLALTEERFPRVVGTNAPLADVQLGDRIGVVTATSASGVHEAHLISVPALDVDTVALASPPSSTGLLPELDLGFAAQTHSEGRVTFFDFDRGDARTLTGFELSAEAVQE